MEELYIDITEPGPQGPSGPAGPQGIQGPQGVQGQIGPQGERGERGDRGEPGERGDKGEKGDKGDTGEQGDMGDGLVVKGVYNTLEALKTAHPVGAEGDAYIVGDGGSSGGVLGIVAGENITVDATNPALPVVSASGGIEALTAGANVSIDNKDLKKPVISVPSIGVVGIVAGENISIDSTDIVNPIVSAAGVITEIVAGENVTVNNTDSKRPVVSAVTGVKDVTVEGAKIYIGANAGKANISSGLVSIGNDSGAANTSGYSNTFIGNNAGKINTTGGYNTFLGDNSGAESTASQNTLIGASSGIKTANGVNTFIGFNSGKDNISGQDNVFIGAFSGGSMAAGDANVFLGRGATGISDNRNQISIGYNATCTAANQITLGNNAITALRCNVTSISALSDERTKEYHEQANLELCYADIMRLPVSRYKYQPWAGTHLDGHVTGYMADDVAEVFPKCVHESDQWFPKLDKKGKPIMETVVDEATGETVKRPKQFKLEAVKEIAITDQLLATLHGAVQYLAAKVEDQRREIELLRAEVKNSGR